MMYSRPPSRNNNRTCAVLQNNNCNAGCTEESTQHPLWPHLQHREEIEGICSITRLCTVSESSKTDKISQWDQNDAKSGRRRTFVNAAAIKNGPDVPDWQYSASSISNHACNDDSDSTCSMLSSLLTQHIEVKEALLVGCDSDVSDGELELTVGLGETLQLSSESLSPDGATEVKNSVPVNASFDDNDILRRNHVVKGEKTPLHMQSRRSNTTSREDNDCEHDLFDDFVNAELDIRLFDNEDTQNEFVNGLLVSGMTSLPLCTAEMDSSEYETEKESNIDKNSDKSLVTSSIGNDEVSEQETASRKLYPLLDLRRIHDGPIIWCKLSDCGRDSTLWITDHDGGNIFEVPDNTSCRMQCGLDFYTLYISEPISL